MLETIFQVVMIVFAATYILGIFWKPEIIKKKNLLKKFLRKELIDLWFNEFKQALLKVSRDKAKEEIGQMEKQIIELDDLKLHQEEELKEMRDKAAGKEDWAEVELKNKDILETEESKKKIQEEIGKANQMIKMAELQIGEHTKAMSMIEKSMELGKDLIKKLC